jgi:hypothetical protein
LEGLSDGQLDDVCKSAYTQLTESYEALRYSEYTRPATITAMTGPNGKIVILATRFDEKGTQGGDCRKISLCQSRFEALLDLAIPESAGPDLRKHRNGGCSETNCVAVFIKLYGLNCKIVLA